MHDYHLKFANEAEADAVLFEPVHDGEGYVKRPRYAAIDVIGTIYKPTGAMLETDVGEMPEMAPIDGWHANVRHTEEAPELEPFSIQVDHPVRVWA